MKKKHLLTNSLKIGDRYVIKKFIGEGGMQEVYLASDDVLARSVALKVPKTESAVKRFTRSAALSARVTHPNVAKTLDYFEIDESGYLVEELIEGEDFGKTLRKLGGRIDPHLAAHIFHHLAKGLAAVHAVGVVHRDLKPTNILVSSDFSMEVIKITDFGIAKMAKAEIERIDKDDPTMTGSKTIVGALPYMAPEVIKKDKPGMPADIWSLGAILFEMLTGERPFGVGLAAVENIVKGIIPGKPKLLVSKVLFEPLSNELWNILSHCLKLNRDERPTAEQLVEQCGNLCYSISPRREGYIYNYPIRTSPSAGFISDLDDSSYFFHKDSYYGDRPEEGKRVIFSYSPGEPVPRAFPVLPIEVEDDLPF